MLAVLTPGLAEGQDALARGQRLAENADFERAWSALAEADRQALTRPERVTLYTTRALVAHALGRDRQARDDLARVLAMGADASLPPTAPPALRETLETLHREGTRPPRVIVDARIEDGMARIEARAEGGADLLREVRIWVHEGEWRSASRVERPLLPGETLRWYVEALGPGDVRLATEGTRERPNTLRLRVEEAVVAAQIANDDETWWAVLGGGGAALVVGVAIAVGVVVGGTGEGTQLSGPRVEFD